MAQSILPSYGFKEDKAQSIAFGNGLINNTWKVTSEGEEFILQRINTTVFKEPENIAHNTKLIADYLKQEYPEYHFVAPISAIDGNEMLYIEGKGFFRMFPFVKGSHSIDVAETPEQAFEAASQFGRFTRLLSGININEFRITIPQFHDLLLRQQQFLEALEIGNSERIQESEELIGKMHRHEYIVEEFEFIRRSPEFILRVTHHDTKINNVLFDSDGRGLCVIDLDTVMPGYFISDLGDMMRTYLSPANEEESDFSLISVRKEFYHSIVNGYYGEMKDVLTETEKKYFFYAGKFMIYMQALRFLTDHLNNDIYYGAKYPGHNFVRAGNQLVLLEKLLESGLEKEF